MKSDDIGKVTITHFILNFMIIILNHWKYSAFVHIVILNSYLPPASRTCKTRHQPLVATAAKNI